MVAAGCTEPPSPHGHWTGTVDTLAGGGVRVVSTSGVWVTGEGWTLTEDLRLGSAGAEGPESFNAVADVAVDRSGRIYVLDRQARELRAFAADGAHLWTVGREGEGPGEFSRPVGVAVDRDGVIWVVDSRNQRFTAYDETGALLRDVRRGRSGPFSGWSGGFDASGRLLDPSTVQSGPRSFAPGVVRLDSIAPEGGTDFLVPTMDRPVLATVGGSQFTMSYPVPFTPSLVWSPDLYTGAMWVGTTAPYRIARISFAGDTLAVVGRDVGLLPVTDEDMEGLQATLADIRKVGGTPDLGLIPDEKPRVRWIEPAPDGHLWVRVSTGAGGPEHAYDVFARDGRYLGVVASPVELEQGLAFGDDMVVGVTKDELDVPYVVRLRIERTGDG